jgi:hypothetical protein
MRKSLIFLLHGFKFEFPFPTYQRGLFLSVDQFHTLRAWHRLCMCEPQVHTMKKKVFCNWPYNSIFELHWTLSTHNIYMLQMLSDKLQKLQLIIYMVQLITIQLQLYHNNFFSTTMQLPYDYIHNVMLLSFFIHPSKFNMWHYEDLSWFLKISISIVHYDYLF